MSRPANNTTTAQILGITPLEIYALKLVSHGSYAWQSLKEDLIKSLEKKGFIQAYTAGARVPLSQPVLTDQGRLMMAALHY